MTNSTNPWLKRFDDLNRDVIFKRSIKHGQQIESLDNVPVEHACVALGNALEEVYYPSAQCLNLLEGLVDRQRAHCEQVYSDLPGFLRELKKGSSDTMLPDFGAMTMLTGFAGTGKSSLVEALGRIQPPKTELDAGVNNGVFPLIPTWSCKIQASASAKDILTTLSGREGNPRTLVAACRSQALRSGVSALVVDEFQFANQSEAHARVTQILLSLGYLGLPTICAANFSLLHRLSKRPQEDQHRLLSDPVFLFPETANSQGWNETLRMMQRIAPNIFVFSVTQDAEQIHRLTFGINRNLVKLLVTGYRVARSRSGCVGMTELEAAYVHMKYAAFRRDVDALVSQHITGRPVHGRSDLWCVFPMPKSAQAELTAKLIQDREKALSMKKLEASMTKEELDAHRKLTAKSKRATKSAAASVIPIKQRHKLSAAELAENTSQAFRDLT